VWRTNFEGASLGAVFAGGLEETAISKDEFVALKTDTMKEVPESAIELGGFASLRELTTTGTIQARTLRENAVKRIEKLNPDIFGPEASQKPMLEKARVADKAAYQKALVDQLKSLACSGDESAPYIVLGLVNNGGIKYASAQAPGLVEAILKPDCPVSAALTEADKAALEKLKKEASGAH
jgi:hypothetical protein